MALKNSEVLPNKISYLTYFLYYILVFSLWPILLAICLVFAVYKKFVDVILRIKHGENYGGILASEDAIFVSKEPSVPSIVPVAIFKCDKSKNIDADQFVSYIKKRIKEKIFDHPEHNPKLTSTLHFFMGYPYWLKNQLTMNDCVKTLPVPKSGFNEQYLMDFVGDVGYGPYPKNGTQMWEFYISETPLENKNDDNYYHFALVNKIHHALTDATSYAALFINVFCDSGENYSENIFGKKKKGKLSFLQKVNLYVEKTIQLLYTAFYFLFLVVGKVSLITVFKKHDYNKLHDERKLTGDKIVHWTNEENEEELLKMIKRVKNRVPNTKFSDVVFTAITSCITNYFERNNYPVPESTSHIIPLLLYYPEINPSKPVKVLNKSAAASVNLPSRTKSLLETLERVKVSRSLTTYHDVLAIYLFVSYLAGLFPTKIMRSLTTMDSYTGIITNIPGTGLLKLFDGCSVEKVIAVAPNLRHTGIIFALITYNNKYKITVTVDKAYVKTHEEAQRFLDDFYYYVRLLDIETEKIYKDTEKK